MFLFWFQVDWTSELHKKFVHAVEQLGVDQAIPSRILELMKVEGLTRHNVASHLQVGITQIYFRNVRHVWGQNKILVIKNRVLDAVTLRKVKSHIGWVIVIVLHECQVPLWFLTR